MTITNFLLYLASLEHSSMLCAISLELANVATYNCGEPHTSELVLKNLLRSMYVCINFRDVRSGTVLFNRMFKNFNQSASQLAPNSLLQS